VPNTLQVINTTSSTVNFSWSASTDNVGVAGYKVYRNASQVGTTAQTSYNDTGLSSGSTYQYTVAAYDAANNQSSQSSALSATTQSGADNQPPTIPGGLSAYAANAGLISLNWVASSDNVGVAGYQLERCTGGGCSNFSAIGTAATNSYNDTSVVPNTAYSYRVKARDAANNWSGYSNVASATTPNAPAAPQMLSAAVANNYQINLIWYGPTSGPAVASYELERCTGVGCTSFAYVGAANSTHYEDSNGLSTSHTYRYRVRAVDGGGGKGPYSSPAGATIGSGVCQ
jgi:chitodextrinase